MVDEPEAKHLEEQEDDEGGPIKSFLEHLEDLRWVLIKSGTAAGVAMLVCLLAGNYVVDVLKWPLKRAPSLHETKSQTVRLTFGTNQLAVFRIASTNDPLAAWAGTNRNVKFDIVPVQAGTNLVLGLEPHPDLSASRSSRRRIHLYPSLVSRPSRPRSAA